MDNLAQSALPHGTPREVAEHVRGRLHDLAAGGGFVFAAVHNLQYGVPPQNVEAMIRALVESGEYPI